MSKIFINFSIANERASIISCNSVDGQGFLGKWNWFCFSVFSNCNCLGTCVITIKGDQYFPNYNCVFCLKKYWYIFIIFKKRFHESQFHIHFPCFQSSPLLVLNCYLHFSNRNTKRKEREQRNWLIHNTFDL